MSFWYDEVKQSPVLAGGAERWLTALPDLSRTRRHGTRKRAGANARLNNPDTGIMCAPNCQAQVVRSTSATGLLACGAGSSTMHGWAHSSRLRQRTLSWAGSSKLAPLKRQFGSGWAINADSTTYHMPPGTQEFTWIRENPGEVFFFSMH